MADTTEWEIVRTGLQRRFRRNPTDREIKDEIQLLQKQKKEQDEYHRKEEELWKKHMKNQTLDGIGTSKSRALKITELLRNSRLAAILFAWKIAFLAWLHERYRRARFLLSTDRGLEETQIHCPQAPMIGDPKILAGGSGMVNRFLRFINLLIFLFNKTIMLFWPMVIIGSRLRLNFLSYENKLRNNWKEIRFALFLALFFLCGMFYVSYSSRPEKGPFDEPLQADLLKLLPKQCLVVSQSDFSNHVVERRAMVAALLIYLDEHQLNCITAKHIGSRACFIAISRGQEKLPLHLYNPVVEPLNDTRMRSYEEKSDFYDQCLLKTTRPRSIDVHYNNYQQEMERTTIRLKDEEAACVQHAIEVLNGTHTQKCTSK